MTRTLATKTRRCSAGERCASFVALGQPARLSRGNPGPLCFACEERRATRELGSAGADPKAAGGREEAARPPAEVGGTRSRQPDGGTSSPCAKGHCRRPAAQRTGGVLLCREHAEADR